MTAEVIDIDSIIDDAIRQGMTQYGRVVRVEVAPRSGGVGRVWDGATLSIKASITKTDKGKPNEGKVELHNLSADSAAWLESEDLRIQVFAGYEADPDPPLLFAGDIDEASTKRDRTDATTTITARDGGAVFDTSTVVETYDGPVTSAELIRRIASERMGLSVQLPDDFNPIVYTQGYTLFDSAVAVLDKLTRAAGLEWSIQDEELVVTQLAQPSAGEVVLITSGQVLGSVEKVTKKGKASRKSPAGGVKLKVLCNGRLRPKDRIQLDTRTAKGLYVIKSIQHEVSTFDEAFDSSIEAVEVSS